MYKLYTQEDPLIQQVMQQGYWIGPVSEVYEPLNAIERYCFDKGFEKAFIYMGTAQQPAKKDAIQLVGFKQDWWTYRKLQDRKIIKDSDRILAQEHISEAFSNTDKPLIPLNSKWLRPLDSLNRLFGRYHQLAEDFNAQPYITGKAIKEHFSQRKLFSKNYDAVEIVLGHESQKDVDKLEEFITTVNWNKKHIWSQVETKRLEDEVVISIPAELQWFPAWANINPKPVIITATTALKS
jgi:hypothetical protein